MTIKTASIHILRKTCDDLIRKACKLVAHGICYLCHQRGQEDHHLIGRSNNKTKYEIDNHIFVCWNCHGILTSNRQKNRAVAINKLGPERYDELMFESRKVEYADRTFYEKTKEKLQFMVAMLENNE